MRSIVQSFRVPTGVRVIRAYLHSTTPSDGSADKTNQVEFNTAHAAEITAANAAAGAAAVAAEAASQLAAALAMVDKGAEGVHAAASIATAAAKEANASAAMAAQLVSKHLSNHTPGPVPECALPDNRSHAPPGTERPAIGEPIKEHRTFVNKVDPVHPSQVKAAMEKASEVHGRGRRLVRQPKVSGEEDAVPGGYVGGA